MLLRGFWAIVAVVETVEIWESTQWEGAWPQVEEGWAAADEAGETGLGCWETAGALVGSIEGGLGTPEAWGSSGDSSQTMERLLDLE